MTWIDGSSYEGEWHDDKQHGKGIYETNINEKLIAKHGIW